MYLLYVDESGSVRNPNERHFVLAGIAVFERQIYHLINSADSYVARFDPSGGGELHAAAMARGTESPWKGIARRKDRLAAIEGGLDVLVNAHSSVTAFAVVVDKAVVPDDPVEYAFEEICNRFNLFLSRHWSQNDDPQRGLVVMDKTHYESPLQGLARRHREQGTRWGNLRNLAEVPLFVDSAASRLIQLADLVAWAVWRRYEFSDTRYFDRVVSEFDAEDGVIHGLFHRKDPNEHIRLRSVWRVFDRTFLSTLENDFLKTGVPVISLGWSAERIVSEFSAQARQAQRLWIRDTPESPRGKNMRSRNR